MLRTVSAAIRSSKSMLAREHACATFSTTTTFRSEDPDFLEMVEIFTENAREITLDKLVKAPAPPGKRHEEQSIRLKNIKGVISLFYCDSVPPPLTYISINYSLFNYNSNITRKNTKLYGIAALSALMQFMGTP